MRGSWDLERKACVAEDGGERFLARLEMTEGWLETRNPRAEPGIFIGNRYGMVLHFRDAAEEVGHSAGEVEVLFDGVLAVFSYVGSVAGLAFGEFEDAGAAWAYVVVLVVAAAEASVQVEHISVLEDEVVVVVVAADDGVDVAFFKEIGYQTGVVS